MELPTFMTKKSLGGILSKFDSIRNELDAFVNQSNNQIATNDGRVVDLMKQVDTLENESDELHDEIERAERVKARIVALTE